ncbi:MAG: hypothetical protein ACYCVD_05380 [Desulfitobacteriaceae bacterium]
MFLYILAISRQYMWIMQDNIRAWVVSGVLSIIIWAIYKRYKEKIIKPFKLSMPFLIFVVIPIVILFTLRLAFPDVSYDVLNARLLIAQRSLTGPVFARNDGSYNFVMNSVSDMAMGMVRDVLGYRLGTIINLSVLLWAGLELDRLMAQYIPQKTWRGISVLTILLVENIYFETNTYMIDLLALPLLIHLLYLTLDSSDEKAKLPYMSFLAGVVLSLKFTNVVFIIPIIMYEIYKDFISRRHKNLVQALSKWGLSFLMFSFALFPFSLYMLLTTGNPVFPLYNQIFHSPYWASVDFKDGRWGPKGPIEMLLWPLLANIHPARISEIPHYSGRLGLGVVAVVFSRLGRKKTEDLKFITFQFLLSSILWSVTTGYIRYGIFLEILAGIIIVLVVRSLISSFQYQWLYRALAIILISGLQLQIVYAIFCTFNWEWSMRPTVLSNPYMYFNSLKNMGNDYSLKSYLSRSDQLHLDNVGAWLETSPLTNGLEVQLKEGVPFANLGGYFSKSAPREKIDKFITMYGQNMYTLCKPENVTDVTKLIQMFNLSIENVQAIDIPYFSQETVFKMSLIKIGPATSQLQSSYGIPLSMNAFNALIQPLDSIPTKATVGEQIKLRFKVTNLSGVNWPMAGKYPVRVGNRWSDMNGKVIINDDGRADMFGDLKPGGDMELSLNVKAPSVPGNYILNIDMVQEGVAWFADKGSKPFTVPIKIE